MLFTPGKVGLLNSRTTNRPPGFNTLLISISPFSRFSKFLIPKATITPSNELSAKFIVSPSPASNSIFVPSSSFSIFFLLLVVLLNNYFCPMFYLQFQWFIVVLYPQWIDVSNPRTKEWFPYLIVSHSLNNIFITFHKQFSIDHAIDFITFMFYIL